ncbi:hypothetical protein LR48_Vigan10g167000 [Vigna angularis]|uniref:Uncharacterized protein n=1 Tax=Phaseolus angularis TaxID=3914 RepID=A0A0L9VLC9_PHAAN|nr:hypothetical protein LR48_Vigan10g167000 [Vigna angularis]
MEMVRHEDWEMEMARHEGCANHKVLKNAIGELLKKSITRSVSFRFSKLRIWRRRRQGNHDCEVTKGYEDREIETRKLKMKKSRGEGEDGNEVVKKVNNTRSSDEVKNKAPEMFTINLASYEEPTGRDNEGFATMMVVLHLQVRPGSPTRQHSAKPLNLKRVGTSQSTLVVELDQSSPAVVVPLPMKEKGRKRSHKEGEKSSSKRSRRDGGTPWPLPSTIFQTEIHIGQKANFRTSSSDWDIVEKMSEKEITNAALELSCRSTMLNWYLVNMADHRNAEDVQAELTKCRRPVVGLRDKLQELTTTHKGCDKFQDETMSKLDVARSEGKEAVEKLITEKVMQGVRLEEADRLITDLNDSIVTDHDEEEMPDGLKEVGIVGATQVNDQEEISVDDEGSRLIEQ